MVAFVCAAFLAFIAVARPAAGLEAGGRRRYWVVYVVFMVLAIYSSFVALLVVPVHLLLVIRRRGLAVRLVGALAIVALCCTPLVVLATSRGSSQLFWIG